MSKRVKAVGPLDAKIMIVGEAPGQMEEKLGVPFCGMSGKLLTELLARVGIAKRDCFITNTLKFRPPGNDIKPYIDVSLSDPLEKTISIDLVRESLAELYAEIDYVKPNIILAFGAVPLWALTELRGITKWRGSILQTTTTKTPVKLMPLIHPAAALRVHEYTHFITLDLRKAKYESEFPEINQPDRSKLILNPDFDTAMKYLEIMKTQKVLYEYYATDIEVINHEVDCISFAIAPNNAICIPFTKGGQPYWTPDHEIILWKHIAEVLETCPIAGQNLAFDATFLYNRYGIRLNVVEDSMIAQAIACPDFPKGLGFICSVYTNEPYYKDDGKEWKFQTGQSDQFWLYNAKDSVTVIEALQEVDKHIPSLSATIDSLNNREVYKRHVRLIPVLTYMQSRGVKMDMASLDKAKLSYEIELNQVTTELNKLAGRQLNPNSPKQLKDYFYIELEIEPYRSKGKITTDDTAMKRLSRRGYKEAELILRARKIRKLLGTYLNADFEEDHRLRGAMNPVGTKTGRLSSGKTIFGTGMNMQNQPLIMKKLMIADNGYCLIPPDYAQAENRIVSEIAPDDLMRNAFRTGKDVHTLTASMVFDIPYDEVSNEPGSSTLGSGERSQRYWGKTLNHALNYGMGPNTFSLNYEIPINDAKRLREKYLSAYTGLQMYWTWVEESLRKTRTLTNPLGRTRFFTGRWGHDLFKEAYNFIPQSTVADMINEYGILYVYENQDLFPEVEVLNQEHDSLWIQVPLNVGWTRITEIMQLLKAKLETPIEWRTGTFVLPAEMKIGSSIGYAKGVHELTPESVEEAYYKSVTSREEALSGKVMK